ncbi:MAG: HAD family hydrolase [Bacteroidota bacterium]
MDIKDKKVVIFDLDDTLYKEVDYVKSAFTEIAKYLSNNTVSLQAIVLNEMLRLFNNNEEVFKTILKKFESNLSLEELIEIYRLHIPNVKLTSSTKKVLQTLLSNQVPMGLLTDGRSVQQRNKIQALKIEDFFEKIVISEEYGSEKPSKANYLIFEQFFEAEKYIYVGDNLKKDFISANYLGWKTVCLLDNGENIHKQDFNIPVQYLPQHSISQLDELLDLVF